MRASARASPEPGLGNITTSSSEENPSRMPDRLDRPTVTHSMTMPTHELSIELIENTLHTASSASRPPSRPQSARLEKHLMTADDMRRHTEALRSFEELLRERLAARPAKNSVAYQFRNTISYWIAVSFIEGSLLFSIGAAASMSPDLQPWQEKALVTCGYFSGAVMFTIGAYLGYFEVINVGQEKFRLLACSGSSRDGFMGSLSYFLGALCFNVNTAAFLLLPAWPDATGYQWAVPWLSGVAGSTFFTAAAIIECIHNRHATTRHLVWWLCFFYLFGSVCFLIAAAAAYPNRDYPVILENLIVNGVYLLGSLAFLAGAWVALVMWKAEQFGLGFIKEINISHTDDAHLHRDAPLLAESGVDAPAQEPFAQDAAKEVGSQHGPSSKPSTGYTKVAEDWFYFDWKQQIFMAVYATLGTTSILDICHSAARPWDELAWADKVISSVTNCLTAHAILVLATIVHRTPTMAPYGYLFWMMRGIALLYMVSSVVRLAAYYQAVPCPVPPPP